MTKGFMTEDLLLQERPGFRDNILDPVKYAWLKTASHMGQTIWTGNEQEMFEDGGFFVPKSETKNVVQVYYYHKRFSYFPKALSLDGMKLNPAQLYLSGQEENIDIICHVKPENVAYLLQINKDSGSQKLFKIIFDSSGTLATGVLLKDMERGYGLTVNVRKQILLTAGAIETAELLLKSGLGPSDHLRKEKVVVFIIVICNGIDYFGIFPTDTNSQTFASGHETERSRQNHAEGQS